jgi:shikimate kinase
VLSLGGGAVLDGSTRAALAGHRVALLEVDLSHATGRVGLNRDRPVLALNPRAQLKALLEQRSPPTGRRRGALPGAGAGRVVTRR